MYIPSPPRILAELPTVPAPAPWVRPASDAGPQPERHAGAGCALDVLAWITHHLNALARSVSPSERYQPELRKRDSAHKTNVTIGIIVAVLLAVFFAGIFAFMWYFRRSVRFRNRSRHRHKHRKSTSSSKSSSDAGAAAAPAPPPADAAPS